eukprot:2314983-Prorocentrum_lima.AAC.1
MHSKNNLPKQRKLLKRKELGQTDCKSNILTSLQVVWENGSSPSPAQRTHGVAIHAHSFMVGPPSHN